MIFGGSDSSANFVKRTLSDFKRIAAGLVTALLILLPFKAKANILQMPSGDNSLQFVTVGDAGNAPDSTGYGEVDYKYQIGKYDVTMAQYAQFLNAVAASDTYGLYSPIMGNSFYSPNAGILQSGSPGSFSYSVTGSAPGRDNMPMAGVSWGDAARFCNWLQNGQPNGAEGNGTTESGAYQLSGATSTAALMAVSLPSHSGPGAAQYFLPSEDEWYKAAYYKGGNLDAGYWAYPTQSDTAPDNLLALATSQSNVANYYTNITYTDSANYLTPVGTFALSPGPYGTFDQSGDLDQWNEAAISGGFRGLRGGSFGVHAYVLASTGRRYDDPADTNDNVGFRVAATVAVPEPGSLALCLGCIAMLSIWRRQSSALHVTRCYSNPLSQSPARSRPDRARRSRACPKFDPLAAIESPRRLIRILREADRRPSPREKHPYGPPVPS
jgi:formylglycine-generating enzyme required for sulfatase activity